MMKNGTTLAARPHQLKLGVNVLLIPLSAPWQHFLRYFRSPLIATVIIEFIEKAPHLPKNTCQPLVPDLDRANMYERIALFDGLSDCPNDLLIQGRDGVMPLRL